MSTLYILTVDGKVVFTNSDLEAVLEAEAKADSRPSREIYSTSHDGDTRLIMECAYYSNTWTYLPKVPKQPVNDAAQPEAF